MGCTYFIGGQEFTEKEFKKHLASELDTYVKNGLVDLTKIKIITNEKNKGSNVREIQKNGQGNAQNEGKQQNGKNDGQEANVQEEKVVQGEVTPPITAQEKEKTKSDQVAEDLLTHLGVKPEAKETKKLNWEKQEEGTKETKISARNAVVTQAAKDLKEGKITSEEHRAIVSENSPVTPVTKFLDPATANQVENSVDANKKGSANKPIEENRKVALRIDIPAFRNNNIWVISVHNGLKKAGEILSYKNVARITDVVFGTQSPKASLDIAAGGQKNATVGRIFGNWKNFEGKTEEQKGEDAKKLVEQIANDPSWVQIGMNPFRHSYFYDRSSDLGRPVLSAKEVVQIGGLVYAKDVKYGDWNSEAFKVKEMLDKEGKPVYFSKSEGKSETVKSEEPKTKSDQVAEDLLTHLGIPVTPKEVIPSKSYTAETASTIPTDGLNEVQAKVINDVKNVIKTLKGLELEVVVHQSPETYEKAVVEAGGNKLDSTSKGFYLSSDGTIHLNMDRVTSETMLHEGFHPILDYLAEHNPDIIDEFHNQLSKLKGGKEIIEEANKNYKGDVTRKKEAITDFVAKIADPLNPLNLDRTSFQKAKDFIVNMLKKMGINFQKDIRSINDLRELAKIVSEKFATGEEIKLKNGSIANSSQRVQFQSDFKHEESGLEWKYFKNSEDFQKLIDKKYVTFDKNIDDFSGAVVLHAPDAAFSGQILKDGVLVADGKGGMYYPLVFHDNGDFWAATARGANSLAKTLNEARAKSPDGKIKMILVSSPIDKLMSSSLNGIGLVDILTSKAFSDKSGITPEQLRKAIIRGIKTTEKLKSENKDGMKPSQKPLPKITSNESLADIHIKLREFYPSENSDFPVRKSLNQNILEGIAKYSSSPKVAKQLSDFLGEGSFNEKLKSTGGKLSRANLTQGFSNILAEPTLRGEQSGKMYAVIELSADVEPIKTSEHESYPFSLRSVNPKEKPVVHILKQRDFWYNHIADENGQSIKDNKEKQASMLPASAGISSVVDLKPTKIKGVSELAEKAKRVVSEVPQFSKDSQEAKIKEFIETQRKNGVSDEDIKAGLEKVAKTIGIKDVDALMGKSPIEQAKEKVVLSSELQKIKDGFTNFVKRKTSGLSETEVQTSIDKLFSNYESNKDFLQELKDNNISLNNFKKEVENELITQPKTNEQQNAINNTEGQVQKGNQPSGSQEYQGTQNVSETPTAETNSGDSGVGGKEKEVAPSGIEPVGEAGKKLNVQPLSGISKAEIKKQHGKVLKFESQTAQEKAEKANDLLNSRAESNGRDADQEAKAHVEELQQKEKDIDFKSSEYDILTTARHKLTLEAEIAELEASGDKDGAEAKRQELDKTLDLLLKLGSKSGTNLGLFKMVMGKMDDGGLIALMPSYAKIYNVSEMPKSIVEMEQMAKDGKLSPNEIAKIRPFVEQIDALRTAMEKYKTDTVKIEAEVDKKAVEDYIKGQVDKAETEAKITTVGKGKGAISKASARRRAYIEKIRKGEVLVGLKPIEGARTQGYNFNTAEVVARALELIDSGLNKIEAIRQTLKSVGAEGNKEIEDEINYHITRSTLPDKAEVLQDLKAIANAEKSATITPEMVNKGLINDIINDNIYTDATYDKVIDNSLKDIQEVLPNATKQELIDALLRKGDFKQKTKTEAENEYKEKEQAVKRLANKVLQEKALSDASTINALGQEIKNIGESNLSPAEKKAEIAKKKAELEAKKSEVEKDLDKRIKKYEDAIKEEKKAIAEKEALKKQEQKRYDNLVKELFRVKNRREKEESTKGEPIQKSQREKDLEKEIEKEKSNWSEEKRIDESLKEMQSELDRVRFRKNKAKREAKEKLAIQYTNEERALQVEIDNEQRKWDAEVQRTIKNRAEYKALETERNRQIKKEQDLLDKIEEARQWWKAKNPKSKQNVEDTPTIERLKSELAYARRYGRQRIAEINKATRETETKDKKLKELEDRLRYVREEKQVYDRGIKDPKKTDEQLQKLRDEIKQAGYDVGVREEMQGKQEIKTAKDYENAIQEAKNSDMDEDVKAKTIADLEAERDELLNNTKQGVLVNLKTSLDGYAKEISNRIVDAIDAKDAVKQKFLESVQLKLQQLSTLTNPSVKNLSDSINQAGQALDAIINDVKDKEIKKELEDLRDEFHANYDKTSTELQRAKLMELAKNQLREAKRRLEAKQYTEVPKSKLDIERDEKLMKAQLEVKAEWQKLNSLKIKAEQGKETLGDKILATRTKLLISSASALEKVGISAITKPIIDTTLKQTFGRLTTKLTGVEPVKFRDIGKAYRGVYLSKEGAKKLMDKATNDYVKAIDNYEAAKKDFGENSKEAQKAKSKLLDAEFDVDAMFPYVFINTNVLTDAKEILLNGATKLDEELGLGRKSYRKERNTIQNIGFFLDGVNRTHSVMKTPSSKIALMEGYMENLRYYQKMEGRISIENRIAAWNLASIGKNAEMKVGRFAESTYLSDAIQKLKSNESRIVRYPAKFIFPVSKIAINITKQGVDMAMPLESIYKLAKASVKGAELRELEGGKYTFGKDLKRGIESLNLEEKKYINTLLYRGAFGLAQYAAMYFLLSDDKIKYGGAYNSFDPFGQKLGRVKSADGKELKAGEWEFFGHKAPKAVEIFINHSPYSLAMSLAANAHEQATREGLTYNQKKAVNKNRPANILLGTTNEILSRLPVSTVVDIMMAMTGDEYKLEKTSSSLIPSIPLIPKEYFMEKDANDERVKRETYDPSYYKRVLNQYKASQPFLEKTLPKKR